MSMLIFMRIKISLRSFKWSYLSLIAFYYSLLYVFLQFGWTVFSIPKSEIFFYTGTMGNQWLYEEMIRQFHKTSRKYGTKTLIYLFYRCYKLDCCNLIYFFKIISKFHCLFVLLRHDTCVLLWMHGLTSFHSCATNKSSKPNTLSIKWIQKQHSVYIIVIKNTYVNGLIKNIYMKSKWKGPITTIAYDGVWLKSGCCFLRRGKWLDEEMIKTVCKYGTNTQKLLSAIDKCLCFMFVRTFWARYGSVFAMNEFLCVRISHITYALKMIPHTALNTAKTGAFLLRFLKRILTNAVCITFFT